MTDLQAEYGRTMSPTEVARVTGHHPAHIRELCRRGELPAIQIGKRWHINTAKLAAMLDGESHE